MKSRPSDLLDAFILIMATLAVIAFLVVIALAAVAGAKFLWLWWTA